MVHVSLIHNDGGNDFNINPLGIVVADICRFAQSPYPVR